MRTPAMHTVGGLMSAAFLVYATDGAAAARVFLPESFAHSGSAVAVDYEYTTDGFAPESTGDVGVYVSPRNPGAFDPVNIVVKSAVYLDPSSTRVTVLGSIIRIDFVYLPRAPVGGSVPEETTSTGVIEAGSLAPGEYDIEAWGRPAPGAAPQRFFKRKLTVSRVGLLVMGTHGDGK